MPCVHVGDEPLSTACHETVDCRWDRGRCLNRDDDSSEAPYHVHRSDGIAGGLPGRRRNRNWELDVVGFRAVVLPLGRRNVRLRLRLQPVNATHC